MANPRLLKSQEHADAGPGPRGGFLKKRGSRRGWAEGIVWRSSAETHLYYVMVQGQPVTDVRRMVTDPGDVSMLPNGTPVVISFDLGQPTIIGVLKSSPTSAVEVNPLQVTELRGVGGEDPVFSNRNQPASARAPNDPIDVLDDDWIRKGKHNNFVGVLAGGTNVLHSSPMSQIRTHSVNDMVEIIANVYRHISSLGNMNITNEGGKTSLVWRAGADQTTENGANVENWTIRLDVGGSEEADLFRLRVTTPHNNTLCEIHLSADGRLSLTGVAGVDVSSGTRGTAREDVAENKEVQVLGAMSTTVLGPVYENQQANKSTFVGMDETHSVGNDLKEVIGHNHSTHVGNQVHTVIDGSGLAVLWEAINGNLEVVAGSAANSTAEQSQTFVNYAGNVNVVLKPTAPNAKFQLVSTKPDSVLLGADGDAVSTPSGHVVTATATQHVMKYEPFMEMMETLLGWLDEHQHLTAMGPTAPAQTSATGPASLRVKPKLMPIKSIRVLVGS